MTLRFNGQSPTSVNGAFSAFPGRMYGTVSGIALQTGMIPLWRSGRAQTGSFGELAGQVDGTTDPVTWLMALRPGRIQSPYNQATFQLSNTLIAGLPGSGSASITFTVGPSQLELVVSAVGSTSINFTLTGNAVAVLQAVGAIAVDFTVGPSTLGAESGIFGDTTISFTATATPRADGNISGAVTPYTELSPQNLAAAVWNAIAAEYTENGSMGELMNSGASGLTAAQVWSYINRSLTSGGNIDIATEVVNELNATEIPVNVTYVNGVQVDGTGTSVDPWGPV